MTTYLGTATSTVPGVEAVSTFSTLAMKVTNTGTGSGNALQVESSTGSAIMAYAHANHHAVYAENVAGGVSPAVSAVSSNTDANYGSVHAVNYSTGYAVRAYSAGGTALFASSAQTSGSVPVIFGYAGSANQQGVFGQANGAGIGVYGEASGSSAYAVKAVAYDNTALHAETAAVQSAIVAVNTHSATSGARAIYAGSNDTDPASGTIYATNGASGTAVFAVTSSSTRAAVYAGNSLNIAIKGESSAGTAVQGIAGGASGIGGWFQSTHASGTGLVVQSGATSGVSLAIYGGQANFNCDLSCPTPYTKAFICDHPLDPANKFLLHACVESPELKNVYDGNATAGPDGEAVVELPPYFEAANKNFRYQLTALDGPAPNMHIKQRVAGNKFVVGGLASGQEVSWQVTGVRNDPGSQLNTFTVERDKTETEKGRYLAPTAYGDTEDRGLRCPPGGGKGAEDEGAKV